MAGPNPIVIHFLVRGVPEVKKALNSIVDAVIAAEKRQLTATKDFSKQRLKVYSEDAAKIAAMNRASNNAVNAEVIKTTRNTARERLREESRLIAKKEAMELASRRRLASMVMNAGANVVNKTTSTVGRVANTVLNAGGGYSVQDSLERRMRLRGSLADLANQGFIQGDKTGKNSKLRSVNDLENQVKATAIKWGADPEKLTEGLSKFAARTGDLTEGLNMMDKLMELSRAGAGSFEDLASAAGAVFNADTTQSASEVLEIIRGLASQGKVGSVEMSDLARHVVKITAAAGQFKGGAKKNILQFGAFAQLAMSAAGGSASASEATNAARALAAQLYKEKRLKGFDKLGVKVKDDDGFNRDMDTILEETMLKAEAQSRKTGHGLRDMDVLVGDAIADATAKRAVLSQLKVFKAAGGGEEGIKALREQRAQFTGNPMSEKDVEEAAKRRMQEVDMQLEKAMIQLRDATAQSLFPAFVRLAGILTEQMPNIKKLLDGIGDLAKALVNNPLLGLGAIVANFMVYELGKAALGNKIHDAILKLLENNASKNVPGAPGGPGATGGPGAPVGKGGIGLGGALAAISVGVLTIDATTAIVKAAGDAVEDEQKKNTKSTIETANNLPLLRGDLDEAARKKAELERARLSSDIEERKKKLGGVSASEGLAFIGATMTMGGEGLLKMLGLRGEKTNIEEVLNARKEQIAREKAAIEEQEKTLARFNTALEKASSTLNMISSKVWDTDRVPVQPTAPQNQVPLGRPERG